MPLRNHRTILLRVRPRSNPQILYRSCQCGGMILMQWHQSHAICSSPTQCAAIHLRLRYLDETVVPILLAGMTVRFEFRSQWHSLTPIRIITIWYAFILGDRKRETHWYGVLPNCLSHCTYVELFQLSVLSRPYRVCIMHYPHSLHMNLCIMTGIYCFWSKVSGSLFAAKQSKFQIQSPRIRESGGSGSESRTGGGSRDVTSDWLLPLDIVICLVNQTPIWLCLYLMFKHFVILSHGAVTLVLLYRFIRQGLNAWSSIVRAWQIKRNQSARCMWFCPSFVSNSHEFVCQRCL